MLLNKAISLSGRLTIASLILFMSATIAGCDREEDDFIPQPTENSTIVTGYIKTPAGTPLENIPVTVDLNNKGLFGSTVIHKAKTTTDRSGFYKIFFETRESEGYALSSDFIFSVDLSVLSSEDYLIAQKMDYRFGGMPENWSGTTFKCNFTVPHKKLVTVTVDNPGEPVAGGKYAVRNVFPFLEGGLYLSSFMTEEDYGTCFSLDSIDIPARGAASVTIPYGAGVENTIGVVYLGNDTIAFTHGLLVSDVREITPDENVGPSIELTFSGH